MSYRAILAALLAGAFSVPAAASASAEPVRAQAQSVELVLQGNSAFAYLYPSYLNNSDWTDISTNGGSSGPLGKVTNTWGGATGMTSNTVSVPSGQWVRACAHYAGAFHCTPWRRV